MGSCLARLAARVHPVQRAYSQRHHCFCQHLASLRLLPTHRSQGCQLHQTQRRRRRPQLAPPQHRNCHYRHQRHWRGQHQTQRRCWHRAHTHTQASQPDCQEKDNGASTLPARTHVRCHTLQTLPTVGAGALQRGRTTARSTSPHRRATTTRSCRETSWTWRSGSVSTAKQRRHLIVTAWRQRNASEPTAPHRRAPRTQAARWKSPASSATGK